VSEFSAFTGLRQPAELRTIITRAHVIAWRKHFESRELAPSSIRRKLSALSALFEFLRLAAVLITVSSPRVVRPR